MASSSTPLYKIKPLPRSLYPTSITYTPQDFRRQDESSDSEWYSQPRFVQHIDDPAISSLKAYYSSIINPSHSVLDIYSSWVSHLPPDLKPISMIGIGMNSLELQRNPHLTSFFVKDLNTVPNLSEIPSESTDIVICNVSVDYLTKPVEVFKEMNRVLKKGGTAHMAFSNRCFPTKVIGKWMGMSDEERRRWVGGYFWASGGWVDVEEVVLKEGGSRGGGVWGGYEDPLFVVRGRKAASE
jgi:SAM-dependent methyltransferase